MCSAASSSLQESPQRGLAPGSFNPSSSDGSKCGVRKGAAVMGVMGWHKMK